MERLSIKINKELYQEIKKLANKQGTWICNIIDKAVEQYLQRRKWNR